MESKSTIQSAPSTKSRGEQAQVGGYGKNEERDIDTILSEDDISVEDPSYLECNVKEEEEGKTEKQMQESESNQSNPKWEKSLSHF